MQNAKCTMQQESRDNQIWIINEKQITDYMVIANFNFEPDFESRRRYVDTSAHRKIQY